MSTEKETALDDHSRVGLTINQGVLVASIQVELYDDVLASLSRDVLHTIRQRGLSSFLLDLTQVEVMDRYIALELKKLVLAASILGCRSVISGIQPGVVVTLVEMGDEWQKIPVAVSVDEGFRILTTTQDRVASRS